MISETINWNCPENCFHRLSLNWSCLNNWCLVLSINWNCPDKWSRRLLIGIVLIFFFTGLSINWNCLNHWFRVMYRTWIEIVGTTVGTTAVGDHPLIGIIRTIEFWRALLFENQQLLCRVQLIALVSTLHKLPLTGWRSSLYTQPFARYKLLH